VIDSLALRALPAAVGEHHQSAERTTATSNAIWIPFCWLFIVSTRSVSNWLTRPDGTVLDPDLNGSPLDRAILTGLIAVGLLVLAARWEQVKRILAKNRWLLLVMVYIGLSVIWSNFPAISFRRYCRSIGTLVMVLVVLTERNPLASLTALLQRCYFIHIPLSILAIKYFRNIGVAYGWDGTEEMWVGLAMHKNNLGQVAMASGLLASWLVLKNWSTRKMSSGLVLLGMTLWVLRGSKNSHSSTAILGFVTGVCVLLALQGIKGRVPKAKWLLGAMIVAVVACGPLVLLASEVFETSPMELVLESTGRDATLTGRTGLWSDILTNASHSPVLGVGFGAFWVGKIGYAMYPLVNWSAVTPEWRPGQGHNGYLDVFVELGAVGLILAIGPIVLAFSDAVRQLQTDFEFARIRLVLLFSLVLNNFTESSLLKGTHSLWFLLLLVIVNVPWSRQERPAAQPVLPVHPASVPKTAFSHRRVFPADRWRSARQTPFRRYRLGR
jgi:exopolysaccharide production protein ExoQ